MTDAEYAARLGVAALRRLAADRDRLRALHEDAVIDAERARTALLCRDADGALACLDRITAPNTQETPRG
jgi:hypothetical protein